METVVISQCEDVVRKRKFSVYSLLFLAIAVVTAYLYSSYQGEAGASIRMAYLVVSFAMFCAALISLLGGKKRIFLKATGERVREYLTVQLSQYKPFSYDVASPLLTFQGDDAQKLSDELLKQAVEV